MDNISFCLKTEAARQPRTAAITFPQGRDATGRRRYVHLTFQQLDEQSDFYAWGMHNLGITPGMKTLLMIRPSLDFYALVFALFKIGAVPIMIDPGMGWHGFFRCVQQVAPEAFLGIPAAHLMRHIFHRPFASIRISLCLGKKHFWSGTSIYDLPGKHEAYPVYDARKEDLSAILFTSGSTGPAKGVEYTHGIFSRQLELLREYYSIGPGEMDLACFPLFSLFSVGLGAGVVVPDMDPTHPADVNPENILEPLRDFPITYSFGSPALWDKVSQYCLKNKIRLPGLKRVIMAGAPVSGRIHDALLNHILDAGSETYTPYGATEALPVCNFCGSEMLRETRQLTAEGAGMCVGKPLPINRLEIIKITDAPIAKWSDDLILPQGQIGEICVTGPTVTRRYYHRDDANALAKIPDGDHFWHRIGDLGYIDKEGRLWFCGRKAHRVESAQGLMCSIRCEAIFNAIPGVRRSALVGTGEPGKQIPVIIIEPVKDKFQEVSSHPERILAQAKISPLTANITEVRFCRRFPVDIRHNAKINREKLRELI